MPAWLLAALALLRSAAFGTRLRTAGTAVTAGALLPFGPGGGSRALDFLPFVGDGEDRVRRRRRRRALTQSDRNDIAFIAATIGKAAAGSFAVQLATRSR